MFTDLFEDTMEVILRWKPKQKHIHEREYRDDLIFFLRKELNEHRNSLAFGPSQRISVTKEDGRGLCDIGINKRIGIELKKDLKNKSQVDRVGGQMMGYMKDYQDLIIVLVGKTNKDALEKLKDRIDDLRRTANSMRGNRIKLIDKGSQIEKIETPPFFRL